MAENQAEFSYIDENLISTHLKCPICSSPYVNPVIRPDGSRSCRTCALLHDNENKLVPVTEYILLGMLDDLPVQCGQCEKKNIRRADFEKHSGFECPHRTVRCLAADLNCPWKGLEDNRERHLIECPFEPLRATLSPLLTDIKFIKTELENLQKSFETVNIERRDSTEEIDREQTQKLVNNFEQTRETTMLLNSRMDHFERMMDDLSKPSLPTLLTLPSVPSNDDFELFRIEFGQIKDFLIEQISRNEKLEKELKNLRMNSDQQRVELERLTSRVSELSNREINENHHQTATNNDQIESFIRELANVKQQCYQQDIQIRLLARTRCVLPVTNNYRNEALENLIDQFSLNSQIDLQEQNINDADLDVIYRKAVIEKQCSQLRLDQNQLTVKSAISLSIILTKNTKLTALFLSNNKLNDTGVHILAQTLSINNDTLTSLELNGNDLTDQSAEYLSEMLKVNRTLESLGLASNRISDQGTRLLTFVIGHHNKTLRSLSLRSNPLITDISIQAFSDMIQSNSSLRSLHISQCTFSDHGIEQMKEISSFSTCFQLSF